MASIKVERERDKTDAQYRKRHEKGSTEYELLTLLKPGKYYVNDTRKRISLVDLEVESGHEVFSFGRPTTSSGWISHLGGNSRKIMVIIIAIRQTIIFFVITNRQ